VPDVYVLIGDGPAWEHLDFNLDNPWFDDVALRQAIYTAVDVDDIGSRVYGSVYPDFVRRTNPTFDSTSPYHVDLVTPTGLGSGDVDAALEILDEAGYDFDGTTLTRDGETVGPFRLRSTSRADRDTMLALVQSYLAEIGIQVTIEPTDALGEMLAGQDYDIALFGWSGSPFFVGTAAQLWRTGSGSNFGQYSNPEFDELADRAERAVTQDEAAEYENRAGEVLMGDAYVLPLIETPIYVFVTDAYANVRDNGSSSLRGVYNDHEWGLLPQ
jgi:peptide/nickel transport system substrate-binding protein